jgi:hypothetical protein
VIPPSLARRIDRLGRRAHAFHRFAHHPLCAAYRPEVVALGTWRLCRGCLLAGCGFLGGLGTAALAPRLAPAPAWILLGAWSAWLLVLTRWRPSKLLSRFLPAAVAAFLTGQGLLAGRPSGWALALLTLGLVAAFLRAYRLRGPHRTPCLTCPEGQGPGVCSGYLPQTRRERAFQRLTGRWLRTLRPSP